MPRRSPQVEEFTPDNRSATMRTASSDNSSNASSSTPPLRRTRMGTMSLSVSAVSPARGTIPRMSSSESSAGSSDSTPQQRAKKRVTQLVFPYAPSIVPEVSFPPSTPTQTGTALRRRKPTSCTIPPAIRHRIRSRTSEINAAMSDPQRQHAKTSPTPPPRLVNRRRQAPRMVRQRRFPTHHHRHQRSRCL